MQSDAPRLFSGVARVALDADATVVGCGVARQCARAGDPRDMYRRRDM